MPYLKENMSIRTALLTCIFISLLTADLIRPATAALPGESKQQIDQRMRWWRDAKFGMFIHWGLYAVPAGQWNGKKIEFYGEWIQEYAKIPEKEYAKLQTKFNPTKYDAKQWVSLAKRAGIKYIVITSKHHDGFCLFDSKHTDYDVMGSPHRRDLLKPLADACRRQGIEICWYHSILDWHHPAAWSPPALGTQWYGIKDPIASDFPKYEKYMRAQLRELLTNYGRIGILWFDGEWIQDWKEENGRNLEAFLREIQPDLIVNNRVGKRKRSPGDFGTPEQEIPATGMPGWDWETCMTMNDSWGFKSYDHNWKSTSDLLRKLVDIVSKGGNFLLNVGPTAEGTIPAPSVERLEEIGRWMDVNGESIYGTTASPFEKLPWGRATKKPGRLFLHVFDWPADGKLEVPGLANKVTKAYLLSDKSQKNLPVDSRDSSVVVTVPPEAVDPIDTVLVLDIVGEPKISQTP